MEVIKKLALRLSINSYRKERWALFHCSYCHNEVERRFDGGRKSQSCGCVSGILAGKAMFKHGDHKNRIHNIWNGMKQRCSNSNHPKYKYYGKRGISVCSQWLDYISFKNWALQNGYKENLCIDRINNDSNYTPDNCRWVTILDNNRNKGNM